MTEIHIFSKWQSSFIIIILKLQVTLIICKLLARNCKTSIVVNNARKPWHRPCIDYKEISQQFSDVHNSMHFTIILPFTTKINQGK